MPHETINWKERFNYLQVSGTDYAEEVLSFIEQTLHSQRLKDLEEIKEKIEKKLTPPENWMEAIEMYNPKYIETCALCGACPNKLKDFVLDIIRNIKKIREMGSINGEQLYKKGHKGFKKSKWEVILYTPLRGATWRRNSKGQWILKETNLGFA